MAAHRSNIELPVSARADARPVAAPRLDQQTAPVANASVLVVEDEAALATAVTDAPRDAGYMVAHAPDGDKRSRSINEEAFDGSICDLKMPRLDGKAFYRTLAAASPGLAKRVIFVTAMSRD